MFILSKRNLIFRGSGNAVFLARKDWLGDAPEWVTETPFFKSCVKDGIIVIPENKKDSSVEAAAEKAAKAEKKAAARAKAAAKGK